VVVNIVTGKTEREFMVPVKNPKSVHGHFRHARLTEAGTLLVAHMDMGKVVEYDATGKEVWSHTPGIAAWPAERLKNGNTLIAGAKLVRGAGSHTRQENRLGVARVGKPGGSGTLDHHSVTG
jgi:hypothetical protein